MIAKNKYSNKQKFYAFCVHFFTSTGILAAFASTVSLMNNQPVCCLFWLGISFLIDAVDGTLARKFNVKEVLPHINGVILDLIIDFITYCFIPALFIYKYISLPNNFKYFSLFILLMTSTYWNCNTNQKSEDYYFNGFLAAWNLIIVYLYIFTVNLPWVNFILIMIFSILSVLNVKTVHPLRVKTLIKFNIFMLILGFIGGFILLFNYPKKPLYVVLLLLIPTLYMFILSAYRTIKDFTSGNNKKIFL